jgi:hypothetical protein
MAPQSFPTTQEIKDTAFSWQDHGKCLWDSEGVIHVDFLPPRATANAQYCSKLLLNDMHTAIRKKMPGKLSKRIILLHNARPLTANLTTTTLQPWAGKFLTTLLTVGI